MQATKILSQAQTEMADRAHTYDAPGGERSMQATVEMFNALTGHQLTEQQGWKFMAILKLVRSEQGAHRDDNFVDGAAYFALAGEAAANADKLPPPQRLERQRQVGEDGLNTSPFDSPPLTDPSPLRIRKGST